MVYANVWRAMERREALHQQGGRCKYCHKPMMPCEATADHIHPRSKGGTDTENIVAACRECNAEKRSLSVPAFKKLIKDEGPCEDRLRMIRFRRRLWLRTDKACERIRRCAA